MAAALLPLAPQTASRLEVGGAAIDQSEAETVDALLSQEFAAPFASNLVLVVTGIPSLDDIEGIDLLIEIVKEIESSESVARVLSYLDPVDTVFLGEQGTFLVADLSTEDGRVDETVLELRETTQSLQARLRPAHPDLELSWTGAAAFDYDLRKASTEQAADAEKRVLPVALALLLVVFGSLIAALCPVLVAGLGVGLSLGAAALLSPFWPMTVLLQNIVSMIGLGIGIDYTLLMISRFREELAADSEPERAAIATLRTSGQTIALSGSAVAIGFAALLVVPATELRSIATGGLLVVGFAVGLATTLLPGLLAWLGPKVDAGRLWRSDVFIKPSKAWLAWGRWVTSQPMAVLLVAGLPLLALAWQARLISTDIPTGSWLPVELESTRGALGLQRMGRSGIVQTIRVIVELPEGETADSAAGLAVIAQLSKTFAADNRVARVNSLPRQLGVETLDDGRTLIVPPAVRRAFISRDGRSSLIDVIPTEDASAGALMAYVRELRNTYFGSQSRLEGTRILAGGLPAFNADYQDAIGGSVLNIILLIIVGSFLALLVGLRSFLVAFKAVALNLLSVAAAMGVTVLVFQQGLGLAWLGVTQPLDGLFPAVPIIVFCVVFGLSMDYEVFLMSRVAEGVQGGLSNTDAIVEGLARTARVITSAALVMIVVFAGFAAGDFLVIKVLGFSLAVAVLFDATIVRLAIGPALLRLGGRWNWWPGSGYRPAS
jgi:RND superfamily putative drug exporter